MFLPPLRTVRSLVLAAGAILAFLSGGVRDACAGLPEALARIKPSIVAVGTYQKLRSPGFVFLATGFAVDDGTIVATNAHVIPEALQTDKDETMMVLAPAAAGTKEPQARAARVIVIDKEHDLALLRVAGPPLPAAQFGDSEAVRDAQSIAFTGFPLGNALGFYPVTHRGIIASLAPIAIAAPTAGKLDSSAVRGLKSGPFVVFQLDTSAYPGHSGSPLYDAESGEVLGIVNMAIMKGRRDLPAAQATGMSIAVPSRYLLELLRSAR